VAELPPQDQVKKNVPLYPRVLHTNATLGTSEVLESHYLMEQALKRMGEGLNGFRVSFGAEG